MSEIFDAVRKGDTDRVERLLSEDKSLVFERDNEGNTPLHIAALCRKARIVKALLNYGAEVNVPNNAGLHPIDAVNDGRYRLVDIRRFVYDVLTEHGAYPAMPLYTSRQLSFMRLIHNVVFTAGMLLALALTYYVVGSAFGWLSRSNLRYILPVLVVLFLLERVENWLRDTLLPYKNMRDNA